MIKPPGKPGIAIDFSTKIIEKDNDGCAACLLLGIGTPPPKTQ